MTGRQNSAQQEALAAIGRVASMCRSAQPDPTVDHEILQLEALKSAVEDHWPLPPMVKNRIDLGPFAAKNIADWNPDLADALMQLDYALQHDLSRLPEAQVATKEYASPSSASTARVRTA
jgi:hypothetical protein